MGYEENNETLELVTSGLPRLFILIEFSLMVKVTVALGSDDRNWKL